MKSGKKALMVTYPEACKLIGILTHKEQHFLHMAEYGSEDGNQHNVFVSYANTCNRLVKELRVTFDYVKNLKKNSKITKSENKPDALCTCGHEKEYHEGITCCYQTDHDEWCSCRKFTETRFKGCAKKGCDINTTVGKVYCNIHDILESTVPKLYPRFRGKEVIP